MYVCIYIYIYMPQRLVVGGGWGGEGDGGLTPHTIWGEGGREHETRDNV